MFPLGHIGLSLLLYAPVAYVLVVRNRRKAMLTGLFVFLVVTHVPDLDAFVDGLAHRGVTHSLSAAVVLGVGCGAGGWVSAWSSSDRRRDRTLLGGCLGSFGVVSHLLGDVITPWGVQPFLPFGAETYTLALVRARDPLANWTLFVAGAMVFYVTLHWAQLQSVGAPRPAEAPSVDSPGEARYAD